MMGNDLTPNWNDFVKQVALTWHEVRQRHSFELSVHHPEIFPLQVAVELIHKQGVELERLSKEVEALREAIGSKS